MKNKNILRMIAVDAFSVLLALIIGAIVFLGPAIKLQAENNGALLLQNGGKYDYLIKNPSIAQITNYRSDLNVDTVCEQYSAEFRFNINEENVYVSVIYAENIEMTEFFAERRLSYIEVENPIYIDYSFSQQYSIQLGDKLNSQTHEFTVAAIYKTLDAYTAYSPILPDLVDSEPSAVYVKTKNSQAFYDNNLKNYQPLGSVNDIVEGKDYSAYISERTDGYNEAIKQIELNNSEILINYLVFAFICGVVLLGASIFNVIFDKKKIQVSIRAGGRSQMNINYLLSNLATFIAFILSTFVFVIIKLNTLSHYLSVVAAFISAWYAFVIIAIFAIIGMVVNIYVINSKQGQ